MFQRTPHTLVWAKLKGYPFWPAKVWKVVCYVICLKNLINWLKIVLGTYGSWFKERGGGQTFSTSFWMRFSQAPLFRYHFKIIFDDIIFLLSGNIIEYICFWRFNSIIMTSLYGISYYGIEQHITLTLPACRCLFTVRDYMTLFNTIACMWAVGVVVCLWLRMAKDRGSRHTQYSVVSVIFYCYHCFVLFALFSHIG